MIVEPDRRLRTLRAFGRARRFRHNPRLAQLCERFATQGGASPLELSALLDLEQRVLTFPAGAIIAREEAPKAHPFLLLSGWACVQRILEDGGRQIFDFIVPGEIAGCDQGRERTSSRSVVALTPIITVDAMQFVAFCRDKTRFPGLARAFARMETRAQDRLYAQVVRLGRLRAYDRLAHLLFELFHRLSDCGQMTNGTVPFPLTQETLADALGLSAVHINRMLQQMRRNKVAQISAGRLSLGEGATTTPRAGSDAIALAHLRATEPKASVEPYRT